MLLEKTNLEKALALVKMRDVDAIDIQQEINNLFLRDEKHGDRIGQCLKNRKQSSTNEFDIDLLSSENIYHLKHIKKICVDYRLRFLDSSYFKGDIPEAAISKIKILEKQHSIELSGFKIMAPSKLFKLKNHDDPLLFVPIGNDYFYFVHKWGNDLHPLRKVVMWPFKSIVNLIFTVVALSYLLTVLVPIDLFTKSPSGYEFWILFLFMFNSMATVVIFYGFALGKNFNPAIWDNKYFNT